MKKFYLSIIALAVGGTVAAQSTFDFESVTLNPDSYDNGSAQNGDWIFTQNESIRMTNVYDTAWGGIWNGFAISNTTDLSTMDYSNQYSAAPGSGAGNSSNYAIYYQPGTISTETIGAQITEFKISNTALAKLIMENGYFNAKQFGSPNNANGQPDGTNGEDWFRVWFMAESEAGDLDSMEFYLADYRFADSTQDYIVDTWETIDLLQAFNFPVSTLNFKLESSDNDPVYGMNTPAYFAIDDIKTTGLVGISTNELTSIDMYPNPAREVLTVKAPKGQITLVDMQGNLVLSEAHDVQSTLDVSNLASGVYVIRWSSASDSYTNRIVIQ
ncbi:MAG: DUF4465 domain-containing protein [bacterium]|nr:DUF4465 domain-containing protein [bacterium]